MARKAVETANILSELYDEEFGQELSEPFRIKWPQLRALAAVPRLDDTFLKAISDVLAHDDRCLIPFDNFLLYAAKSDLSHHRMVPDRMVEKLLPGSEDLEVDEDEDEDTDDSGDIDI